jgi:hypothetical protein
MTPDNLSRKGAHALALRLQRYWADRGYVVEARVRIVRDVNGDLAYTVESDMINGRPRRKANSYA